MVYQLGDGWDAASGIASAASGAVSSIFNWKTGTEVARSNERIATIQASAARPETSQGFQPSMPVVIAAGAAILLLVGVVAWRR